VVGCSIGSLPMGGRKFKFKAGMKVVPIIWLPHKTSPDPKIPPVDNPLCFLMRDIQIGAITDSGMKKSAKICVNLRSFFELRMARLGTDFFNHKECRDHKERERKK